jgi:transcription elongation GreA/GreB family factor
LLRARLGDSVTMHGPGGAETIEVVGIDYPAP